MIKLIKAVPRMGHIIWSDPLIFYEIYIRM